MLQFVNSTTEGTIALTGRLRAELSNGLNVLWLVSGGSNIPLEVETMKALPAELTANLTVALTDERFGPVGHADSNWHQLEAAGFDLQQATKVPMLIGFDDLDATVASYNTVLQSLLAHNQVVLGQFGMGPDGHIAGILPHTPAVTATGLAFGYHTDTYDRITSTFTALKYCTVAYLFAFGEAKHEQLQKLQQQDLPLAEQPAQMLKELPEIYVYNDLIGGNT